MNSSWDLLVLIGALAVGGVGLYLSIPRVLPLKTPQERVIGSAILLGIGLAAGVVVTHGIWGESLHCNLHRTPLEGHLSDARAITCVAGVQGDTPWGPTIYSDPARSIVAEAQNAGDDGNPENHILRLLSRRGLLTPAVARTSRDQWHPNVLGDSGVRRTYWAEHGLLTEYTDESGRACIHVLLRESWPRDPNFGWVYHEEVFDARSGAILDSADFRCATGPGRFLTTPILLLAASAVEVGVIAAGAVLWRRLRRRRTAPGGFPVVLPAQSAGPSAGGRTS